MATEALEANRVEAEFSENESQEKDKMVSSFCSNFFPRDSLVGVSMMINHLSLADMSFCYQDRLSLVAMTRIFTLMDLLR